MASMSNVLVRRILKFRVTSIHRPGNSAQTLLTRPDMVIVPEFVHLSCPIFSRTASLQSGRECRGDLSSSYQKYPTLQHASAILTTAISTRNTTETTDKDG